MPRLTRTAEANAEKSAVRAAVEHAFLQPMRRMKLIGHGIGPRRAATTSLAEEGPQWPTSPTISVDGAGGRPERRPPDGKSAKVGEFRAGAGPIGRNAVQKQGDYAEGADGAALTAPVSVVSA